MTQGVLTTMADDTRLRTGKWPHGPFLVLPDPDETLGTEGGEPDTPRIPRRPDTLRRPDSTADTGAAKETPAELKTAGETGKKTDKEPDTARPKNRLSGFFKKSPHGTEPDDGDAEDYSPAREDGPETIVIILVRATDTAANSAAARLRCEDGRTPS